MVLDSLLLSPWLLPLLSSKEHGSTEIQSVLQLISESQELESKWIKPQYGQDLSPCNRVKMLDCPRL